MKKLIVRILIGLGASAVAGAGSMEAVSAQSRGIALEAVAPTAVETGQAFRIEFTINSLKVEFTPPDFGDFEVLAGPSESTGTSISVINGETTRTEATTYTYVIRGVTAGLHTISAAEATVGGKSYSTKPVTIEVVGVSGTSGAAGGSDASGVSGQGGGATGASGQSGAGGASGGGGAAPEISAEDVFIRATVNRTEVYKDEPVVVTFKLYRRGINIDGLENIKLPAFNGFWQQDITSGEAAPQRETYNERVYDTFLLREHLLYPQQPGTLTIEPFEATVNAIFQERSAAPRSIFDDLFGGQNIRQVSKKISSKPVKIEVRDLPEEGRPASFDNAVGDFRLETTPPPGTMKANESGTYTLRLSGTGNFPLIRAPKLALPQSFEQYNVTTSDNTRNTRAGTNGYREFSYPFIPRSDGLYAVPAFEFSYFDPQARQYRTLSSRETSIEITADSTAMARGGMGGMVSGVSREDLRVFGQDIQFIKRGGAGLRPKGRTFMWSPLYVSLLALLVAMFVCGFLILPRYVRNMQSDRFVRGKYANKVALRRFRAAETSMKRDDRHGFHDEMLKALWGYMSDKFDIPMADLTKERIREVLFERSIPEAQSIEYVRIISECEEAQYSPVSSSRMGELYREGIGLVSELESAIKKV